MAILIGNSKYEKLGGRDLTNVESNINTVKSKLKTVFNYSDDEIKVF